MKSISLRDAATRVKAVFRSPILGVVLSAALLGLALIGCQQSEAWRTVVNSNIPGKGRSSESHRYAVALREFLGTRKIESKVATFRYAVRVRTAPVFYRHSVVVYRDESTPDYSWWLMDNFRGTPIWLPHGTLQEQIAFAMRRPVEILAVEDGSAKDAKWVNHQDLLEFPRLHGTLFDPESPLDREKMAAIRRMRPAGDGKALAE